MFAHVAGVPVEELLPTLAAGGGALLAARAWMSVHLRRIRRRSSRAQPADARRSQP
jgi:hypothetical protein